MLKSVLETRKNSTSLRSGIAIAFMIVLVAVMATIMTGCGGSVPADDENIKIDKFSTVDLDGSKVTEKVFSKNKITLINVFSET